MKKKELGQEAAIDIVGWDCELVGALGFQEQVEWAADARHVFELERLLELCPNEICDKKRELERQATVRPFFDIFIPMVSWGVLYGVQLVGVVVMIGVPAFAVYTLNRAYLKFFDEFPIVLFVSGMIMICASIAYSHMSAWPKKIVVELENANAEYSSIKNNRIRANELLSRVNVHFDSSGELLVGSKLKETIAQIKSYYGHP